MADKLDDELEVLSRELAERTNGNWRSVWRSRIWHLTIWSAYAMKRTIDIGVSGLAILFLSPIFVGTYLAVRLTSKGPAFFSQTRVGRDGRHFAFYKFRSMYT